MRKTALGAMTLVALLDIGCGGGEVASMDAGLRGPSGGALHFDAAMLARDGGAPAVDGAVRPDTGPPVLDAGPPVTGDPDVPRTHVGHPDWNALTVLSHHLVQDVETDFEQLFLVVRNDDPSFTYCSVVFRVEFFDAAGASITWRTGTFDGEPRRVFSVDGDCIPPGTIGLGYGNSSWLLARSRVARIEYSFQGSGGRPADVQTIATFVNEGQEIVDPYGGGRYRAVRGRLRVLGGSMRSPDVTVFPLDARGLPYEKLGQIELISLYAGSTWPYTTTATDVPFTQYLLAHSFRGTSSALLADSPEVRALVAARDEHERLRDEMEARARGSDTHRR